MFTSRETANVHKYVTVNLLTLRSRFCMSTDKTLIYIIFFTFNTTRYFIGNLLSEKTPVINK